MVERQFWLEKISNAWRSRSLIWLSGVRRTGKTCLSQSIPEIDYFDCELPSVRRLFEDPESFLKSLSPAKKLVLDEIHRLENPSEVLKIATDHFPAIKILATGSSTLGASTKFKDTLSGRKTELWLTPMTLSDLADFGNDNLEHRLRFGGLPPFFLQEKLPERDFQEWMDSYWSKDVLELFRLERRQSFLKFTELLFLQSGGIFEATRFSKPCEVSRPTIGNYLSVLEATFVMHVLRPFNTRRSNEIISAPKVYGMDTGFVAYYRGWNTLRTDDLGYLWEHLVLNELQACLQTRNISYWRDKQGHELDFVLSNRGSVPTAVECKWSASNADLSGLKFFRQIYPEGSNFVVCQDVNQPMHRKVGELEVVFTSLADLIGALKVDRS